MRPTITLAGRRTVHDGWNRFDILTVESRSGGETATHQREVIDHGQVVAVLPFDPHRRLALLGRQWRAPLLLTGDDPFVLEVCAGLIDAGETPRQAALREAEEELGVYPRALRPVGAVYASPGALTEKVHLFLAEYSQADRRSEGGGLDHEGEDIEIVEMPLDRLFALAGEGGINDAKTLILAQILRLEDR